MTRSKKPSIFFALLAATWLFQNCRGADDELDLPAYEAQPVVECYLENGKPIALLLTLSSPFFAPFGDDPEYLHQAIFVDSALVILEGASTSDTLLNEAVFDPATGKYHNYHSPRLLKTLPGDHFRLKITLKNGQTIESEATMPDAIKFDSVRYEASPDLEKYYRISAWFTDDTAQKNHYHYLLNYENLTDSLPRQDLVFSDEIFQTPKIQMLSGYDLRKNATAFVSVYNISPEYFEFLESVQFALLSGQNPLSQPSKIRSNVRGSANPIGIFAGLAFDRDTIKIE